MSQIYCLNRFAPVNLPKHTEEAQLQIHRKNGEARHMNINGPKFHLKLQKWMAIKIFLGIKKFTLKKATASCKIICMPGVDDLTIEPVQQNVISTSMYY